MNVLKCPVCCGPTKPEATGNGGLLYIGEDNEVFDEIPDQVLHRCQTPECNATFYMGG